MSKTNAICSRFVALILHNCFNVSWTICTLADLTGGEIEVETDPVSIFAGEPMDLSWECRGPAGVRITLCKGGPCSYNGGASDPYYVQNIASHGYCDHRSGYTWSSPHTLATGDDYRICLEDYEASSVRGCAVVNISTGEIDVEPAIGSFYAGESIDLSWTCRGPDSLQITLCKGGPCSYGAGAADPRFIMNIDSHEACSTPAFRWSSTHSLATGDDYHFCLQDYEASIARGCAVVTISAGEIDVQTSPESIYAGESIDLSWTCRGPDNVQITLCK
eukprot:6456374-Amphidinium_carterae.1